MVSPLQSYTAFFYGSSGDEMRTKKCFSHTIKSPIYVIGEGTIVGECEAKGPFGKYFDVHIDDDLYGETSWEKAESKMFYESVRKAIEKSKISDEEIQLVLGGDLLNQNISANFAARQMNLPFLGLYGACSTMTESLIVGAMALESGYASNLVCAASSHFSTAERQFRTPLELGTQRTPTSQRTVTGAGATVLSTQKHDSVAITGYTVGKIIDYGIKDGNNMGAAMAPAACDTFVQHFSDFARKPSDYDAIYTGDLGKYGKEILIQLLKKEGYDAQAVLHDCGAEIFDDSQDPHMGGSGCGCCASMLNAYLIPKIREGKIRRLLVAATGALLSPTSSLQGESIPAVAHAVIIERRDK